MRKLLVVLAFVSVITLVLGLGAAYAEGENVHTQTSTASLTIPHSANLVITNANPSLELIQDGSSEAAFGAGMVELAVASPTLTVRANKNWKLSAKVTTPFAANGTYTKAVSDLQVKNAGAHSLKTAYTSFVENADLDLASFASGVKDEANACQYNILLDYTKDIPGTYSATVTYTLTTLA